MFFKEKIIEFSSPDIYCELEQEHPIPIKLNIPNWYKKLKHTFENKTVKGCVPFLETLTTGYLLKLPQSIKINFNVDNPNLGKGEKDTFVGLNDILNNDFLIAHKLNLMKHREGTHPPSQIEGCPYVDTNKNQNFIKIINPWKIKTPPGYSCLFVPPLNNTDDRFFIIPGIVHTDKFPSEINFPIVINGDKYPHLDTVFERGTPYVQIIPFKRENWKMKIRSSNVKERNKNSLLQCFDLIHTYKQRFWNKTSWK